MCEPHNLISELYNLMLESRNLISELYNLIRELHNLKCEPNNLIWELRNFSYSWCFHQPFFQPRLKQSLHQLLHLADGYQLQLKLRFINTLAIKFRDKHSAETQFVGFGNALLNAAHSAHLAT